MWESLANLQQLETFLIYSEFTEPFIIQKILHVMQWFSEFFGDTPPLDFYKIGGPTPLLTTK